MHSCPNYGPFLGTLNIRGRIIIGIQKGTIILTTTHMEVHGAYYLLVFGIGVISEIMSPHIGTVVTKSYEPSRIPAWPAFKPKKA